jgi:hypothetical protein
VAEKHLTNLKVFLVEKNHLSSDARSVESERMTERSDKGSTPRNSEYHAHQDHRRRAKERLLNAPYQESNNYDPFSPHGKVHQVQFKVSPFVGKTGEEVAALFNLSLSQYCKALLYSNLGIFESTDRRRKRRK